MNMREYPILHLERVSNITLRHKCKNEHERVSNITLRHKCK